VGGAAKRFGISVHVVRRWLRCGLVLAQSEPYGPYPRVWWLEIDEATAARLATSSRTTASIVTAIPRDNEVAMHRGRL
jgi:hypothetical protein